MEQAQWTELSSVLRAVCRSLQPLKRSTYSHYLIARLYFWAVLHGRPISLAVEPLYFNRLFRPRKCPSVSQLNRRVASDIFQLILQRTHERLSGLVELRQGRRVPAALYLDGKALAVSPVSGDRDARRGYMGRGYKLHAVVTDQLDMPVFCVTALNRHEVPVAFAMLEHLPPICQTLMFADGNYDAQTLHKRVHAQGGWLITHPRRGGTRGRARGNRGHPVTRRQMGEARRALIDAWEAYPQLMRQTYKERTRIERLFGHLVCTPGLLGAALPPHVRGLQRVKRWVGAKICLYHARKRAKEKIV